MEALEVKSYLKTLITGWTKITKTPDLTKDGRCPYSVWLRFSFKSEQFVHNSDNELVLSLIEPNQGFSSLFLLVNWEEKQNYEPDFFNLLFKISSSIIGTEISVCIKNSWSMLTDADEAGCFRHYQCVQPPPLPPLPPPPCCTDATAAAEHSEEDNRCQHRH